MLIAELYFSLSHLVHCTDCICLQNMQTHRSCVTSLKKQSAPRGARLFSASSNSSQKLSHWQHPCMSWAQHKHLQWQQAEDTVSCSKSAYSYRSGDRIIVGRTEPITPPQAILMPSHSIFSVLAITLYVKHAPISLLFLIMAGKVYPWIKCS